MVFFSDDSRVVWIKVFIFLYSSTSVKSANLEWSMYSGHIHHQQWHQKKVLHGMYQTWKQEIQVIPRLFLYWNFFLIVLICIPLKSRLFIMHLCWIWRVSTTFCWYHAKSIEVEILLLYCHSWNLSFWDYITIMIRSLFKCMHDIL